MNKEFQNIRTGVIGVGSMGQHHARVLSELSNFVAVADSNSDQGKSISEKYGVKWYKDYREMLSTVDAVSIVVPTIYHNKVATEVSKQGVHLLVEKPLAPTIEEAKEIIESSRANKVILAVGHIERHNPVVTEAHKRIVKGEWGKIVSINAKRVSPLETESFVRGETRRIDDVGVLFDLSIHDVDIISYLAHSHVVLASAMGSSTSIIKHEDNIGILLKFDNGITAICESNWLSPTKERSLKITFKKHNVFLDFVSQKITVSSAKEMPNDLATMSGGQWDRQNFIVETKDVAFNLKEPLKCEIIDFLEAINSKKRPLVSGEDGLEAVKIVNACKKSMHIGETIKLEDYASL